MKPVIPMIFVVFALGGCFGDSLQTVRLDDYSVMVIDQTKRTAAICTKKSSAAFSGKPGLVSCGDWSRID